LERKKLQKKGAVEKKDKRAHECSSISLNLNWGAHEKLEKENGGFVGGLILQKVLIRWPEGWGNGGGGKKRERQTSKRRKKGGEREKLCAEDH